MFLGFWMLTRPAGAPSAGPSARRMTRLALVPLFLLWEVMKLGTIDFGGRRLMHGWHTISDLMALSSWLSPAILSAATLFCTAHLRGLAVDPRQRRALTRYGLGIVACVMGAAGLSASGWRLGRWWRTGFTALALLAICLAVAASWRLARWPEGPAQSGDDQNWK